MNFAICEEVVFKSGVAIVQKKVLLSNYNFATTKLSSHWAWVECTSVFEFQLSLRYFKVVLGLLQNCFGSAFKLKAYFYEHFQLGRLDYQLINSFSVGKVIFAPSGNKLVLFLGYSFAS